MTGVEKHNISCFANQHADLYSGLNHKATWPVSSAILARRPFDSKVFLCVMIDGNNTNINFNWLDFF